ncbi:MAG: CotH kinase family protein, partial [Bacteroidia bacterium]|nr:CotH kinase family protein [Bacteroidia bacterium]
MKKLLFILSIISTLCKAQITAGDNLFNVTQVHTVNIVFPQSNYWTLLVNNKAYDDANDSSTYIPAQVIIDGITTLDSVGIQFKGNSSYYNYPGNKKPFTLSFDEYKNNQKYDSLSSINLNNCYQDPSFMREKLFLDFLNSKGLSAPRSNYAKLYINGVYSGFYQIGERINKPFCKDRFGNKGGNLFKGDGNGPTCADLKYHGTLASYYNCYTLKTNKVANNWSDLINLTKQINTTTNTEFKDSVDKVLNANSFIGAWAACNMFVDFDSYAFRFVHNYYIYHNTATDKFEWITWDASTVFGMDVPGTVASIENKSIFYIEPNATD